jgi:hypothetical protein
MTVFLVIRGQEAIQPARQPESRFTPENGRASDPDPIFIVLNNDSDIRLSFADRRAAKLWHL